MSSSAYSRAAAPRSPRRCWPWLRSPPGSGTQPGTPVDGRQTTGRYDFPLGVRGRAPVMSMPRDHIAADPAAHGRPGASHADREQVIEVLKTAFVQGRLTKDEFGTRIGQALTSQTYAELTKVTAPPSGRAGGSSATAPARPDAAPPVDERGPVGRRVRDARGARGHDGGGRQPQRDSGDQCGRDHRDLGGPGIRGPDGRVVAGESTLTEGEERRSLRKRTASTKTRLPAWASVPRPTEALRSACSVPLHSAAHGGLADAISVGRRAVIHGTSRHWPSASAASRPLTQTPRVRSG